MARPDTYISPEAFYTDSGGPLYSPEDHFPLLQILVFTPTKLGFRLNFQNFDKNINIFMDYKMLTCRYQKSEIVVSGEI